MTGPTTPPPFLPLTLGDRERAQLEEQLSAAFGLSEQAATTWVATVSPGHYLARTVADVIAASFAVELLELRRGDRSQRAVMLQSVCVHPGYRGRGFGVTRSDLEGVRARFDAGSVVLSLYDDGLVPYWSARGFAVEYHAEVVSVEECLRRARAGFTPRFEARFVEAKIAETEADGEEAVLRDGLLAVRPRGADALSELLIVDADAAEAALDRRRHELVALKTIMSYPRPIGLFAPFNV